MKGHLFSCLSQKMFPDQAMAIEPGKLELAECGTPPLKGVE
jgi:hypothetical protein